MRWSIKIAQIAGTEVRIHLTFPMDGGRVLRSLLAMTLPYARATRIAAWIGQALAFVFGFVGLFTNPMLIFIAFFIFLGAQRESAMAQMKDLSLNLRVAEAMVTHLVRLPPDATLEDAVEALLRTSQHEFPVVDEDDRVLGVLTRDSLIAALKRHGPQTPVVNVMQRDLPVLQADEPFDKAFQLMQQSAFPALPVVDRRLGRPRGPHTREHRRTNDGKCHATQGRSTRLARYHHLRYVMTTPNTIPWNFVTKNLQGSELLHKKLQEKLPNSKSTHHFPSDAVHLQVVLERHPKKPLHTAALTLRVPSNILHSEKSSPDVISAFDNAVKALLRELQSLKADLRRERFWKRKERRKQLRQLKTTGFAAEPMAEGSGPRKIRGCHPRTLAGALCRVTAPRPTPRTARRNGGRHSKRSTGRPRHRG